MVFGWLSPSSLEVIVTADAGFQFMSAFANGLAVPAQLSFGKPLSAASKGLDGSGQE